MKLTFSAKRIEDTPKNYLRVALTQEPSSIRRIVREGSGKGTVETLELGVGKPQEMTARKFVILCRAIVQSTKQQKYKKLAIQFDKTPDIFKNLHHISPEEISSIAAQNFEMANFEFTSFKTKPREGFPEVEEILLCGKSSKSIEQSVRKGQEIGREVNACRELANTPSSDMTPVKLAQAAKIAVKGLPVTVRHLTPKDMQKLGMGAVLGVGKGSSKDPAFIVMEYKGASSAPIILAGKGVTFDSGGINIKPDGGHEMHMDMSGGAAVIHAVALAAKLKLKKQVIGLVPAVENMPGSGAYRIHDILKSLSGKTIEILHTDAEGRVILADALTYAKRYKPSVVIDVATLTGAAMVALGQQASGLFTRDEKLADTLLSLSESSGDYLWRLPLWDEYESAVMGTVGDVVNSVGGATGRYGGATNGAMFLWQFAKELECPWAHLDIAPRMTAAPGEELAKGAAGAPVRLLISFIEQWEPGKSSGKKT
jgi:leucyl aminopeptidase